MNVALPCAVVAFNACKDALVLNDSLGYGSTAPGTVIVVHDEVAAMVRVVNHLEIKNPTIAPDLNIGLAGMVEDCGKAKEYIRFLVLDDARFVVPVAKDQQEVRIGPEPFDGRVNDGVKVSPVVVFGSDVVLAPARVALALHQTKKVPIYEDFRTPASCFFEVVGKQRPVALGVVPMQVGEQKKFLGPSALDGVDVFGMLGYFHTRVLSLAFSDWSSWMVCSISSSR